MNSKKVFIVFLCIIVGAVAIGSIYIKAMGGYSQTTTINGVIVPSEPDTESNNSTLEGIDANHNGVRDDVERILAKQFGGTSDYPYAIRYAQAYQKEIVSPTPKTREEALKGASKELCATEGASDTLMNYPMNSIMINTPARQAALRAFNDVLVGFMPQELPPCDK